VSQLRRSFRLYATTGKIWEAALRENKPKFHVERIADQLSAHAAMVQAGFRNETITVPTDDADHALRLLLKKFGYDRLKETLEKLSHHEARKPSRRADYGAS
jgi:hypothetical protein